MAAPSVTSFSRCARSSRRSTRRGSATGRPTGRARRERRWRDADARPAGGPARAPRSASDMAAAVRLGATARALPNGLAARALPRPRLAEPGRAANPPRARRARGEGTAARGRLGQAGMPPSWRVRSGRGVVTLKSAETVQLFLRRIGAGASLLELEVRQVARSASRRAQPGDQRGIGEPHPDGHGRGPAAGGDRHARRRRPPGARIGERFAPSRRPAGRRPRRRSASWRIGCRFTDPPCSGPWIGSSGSRWHDSPDATSHRTSAMRNTNAVSVSGDRQSLRRRRSRIRRGSLSSVPACPVRS